ncbi:hypothetical protein KGF56_003383 [Candida oxycetoniae]|uniref:Uncharacterized protein n=1 Tax=Candida oxycetoniae TaxID=497107 RepID=A0AAI9SVG3_9ASCO|nr:uncharacterized protein KGF56_003383 [Candida oxycetoniae]KAI3403823.2 hypothetical protein KGF56_003383 [Candida oxycetoniae]
MLFSKTLLTAMLASASLIKAEELDTTIVSTITITMTLYTPEESLSLEAARIASEESVASQSSVEAMRSLAEEYYASLSSVEYAKQTAEANKDVAGYSNTTDIAETTAIRNTTATRTTATTRVGSSSSSSSSETAGLSSVETSSQGAAFGIYNKEHLGSISVTAGFLAVVAAIF